MLYDLMDYILGIIKLAFYKLVYLSHMKIDFRGKFSNESQIRIYDKGSIKFGKNMTIRAGTRIRINGGKLSAGKNVGFNNNCCINCMDKITIGDNVIVGQNVLLYDHDHNFRIKGIIRDNGFKTKEIVIGNNVWIGSGCIILKGTHIGNNCVIGAGCIVKGTIPDNQLVTSDRTLKNKDIVVEG